MTVTPLRARDVACPWCHVRVGESCRRKNGEVIAEHASRRVRAILLEEAKKNDR